MVDSYDRGTPSSLRGRLSDVFFPALLTGQARALSQRLGPRGTVDDPIFGRQTGLADLEKCLNDVARWLADRNAAFESFGLVTGSDRDVTEGTLTLLASAERIRLPVALVTERKRERAVELRLYYATAGLHERPAARSGLPSGDGESVPPSIATHIDALARGDVAAAVGSFELAGTVRDGRGAVHEKLEPDGGPMADHYRRLLGRAAAAAPHGIQVRKNARADDGRTCALECSVAASDGNGEARAGLAVYDRGESGLIRTLRVYGDISI